MDKRAFIAQSLFRFLERIGTHYCVVGDTRHFLETIPSDIDIVVPAAVFHETPRIVAAFCREADVRLVQLLRHEQTAAYFVLAWEGDSGRPGFLAVDFCSDYFRGARRLLCAEEIVAQRGPLIESGGTHHDFCVPAPHMQFIYYLLKKVDKQDLRSVHGDYLSSRWAMDENGAWGQICRFWPAADAELLARAAAGNSWFEVRAALPRLRRALHRSLRLSPAWMAAELRRRVARALRPTGLVVAFLGPDGSGKSSVIERVLADLAPAFRGVSRLHLRPRTLTARRRDEREATAPHALPARGRVASTAKLVYFLLDYLVGYALRVWPMVRRSTLVLFDRHYRDLAIDAKRYRYGGPARLARWMAALVPGPDFWVLLDAPVEVLHSRKREVPAEESEHQRRAYLELAHHLRNAAVVDASQSLDHVAADAESAILRWMEGRLEFRHRELQFRQNPLAARLLQHLCRNNTPLLAKAVRLLLHSDVHCRIYSPILMAHPYGIVIHTDAQIGHRVAIMQQVTLGGKDWGVNAAPVIEDDVYIGAGAKILGAVRVGRGATVGANAVVTRDVMPYHTVVGANRIIKRPPRSGWRGGPDADDDKMPSSQRMSA